MNDLQISMFVLSIATLLGYISSQHLKVQPSVGILMISLGTISLLKSIEILVTPIPAIALVTEWITTTNFHELLLDLMLPILLFAGAVSLQSKILKENALEIGVLASISTIASFLIIGSGFYYMMQWLSMPTPWLHCLLFGALISPTDPVAVIGMLKYAKISPSIEAKVAGESLFNDGIGIVIFLTLYEVTFHGTQGTIQIDQTLLLFAREFLGGIAMGAAGGFAAQKIMQYENFDTHANILISLLVVSGLYTLCNAIHVSGPLAVVCAGIMISQHLEHHQAAKESMTSLWGTLEEILNMFLYLLIGLESLELQIGINEVVMAIGAIILALGARTITVLAPLRTLLANRVTPTAERILIWGGLRGGLAIALALSLPSSDYHNHILIATYAVVCFTNLVQGGTINRLMKAS